jgi:hypothetical protein
MARSNRKAKIMKPTTVLALITLTCSLAIPRTAEARYQDGMSLYQYVKSHPSSKDPMGLYIEINDQGYWSWALPKEKRDRNQFADAVVPALRAMCPCVTISTTQDRSQEERTRPASTGPKGQVVKDIDTYSTTSVAASLNPNFVEAKSFCKCWCEHAAGCTMLRDLLKEKARTRIQYYDDMNGLAQKWEWSGDDPSRQITDPKKVSWNPDFPGWDPATGPDPDRSNKYTSPTNLDAKANEISILAHELRHSWDYTIGNTQAAQEIPNARPPEGFTADRWYRETMAVRTQNQVFGEVNTGPGAGQKTGGRTTYGGNDVPGARTGPFKFDQAQCEADLQELGSDGATWGGPYPRPVQEQPPDRANVQMMLDQNPGRK